MRVHVGGRAPTISRAFRPPDAGTRVARPRRVRSRFTRLGPVLVLSFLGSMSVACTRVKVENVKSGPAAGEWKAITCSRMNEKCFKTAEKLCPNGYVFARANEKAAGDQATLTTLPPQKEWHDEMYSKKPGKLLVQCASSPPKLQASVSEPDHAGTSPQ